MAILVPKNEGNTIQDTLEKVFTDKPSQNK